MQLFDFNIADISSGISSLFSVPASHPIESPSLSVQSLHHPMVSATKSINFADMLNLNASMALRKDPSFTTNVRRGDNIEIKLFEPENENYSWQVATFGCDVK